MAERRRWADIWHASSRDEAVARVELLHGEYVVAAIPGDRKWCVLVARSLTDAEIAMRIRAHYGAFVTTPDPMTALAAVTTT